MNKILSIQALRGIAVILVVALHLTIIEEKYGHGFTILPKFFAIGHSGVDLFFVISGFVMVVITRGWFQKTGTIFRFLYHRLTRIYPIYWFYSLLMLAIFIFQQKSSSSHRIVDITASFLLLPQNQLPLLVVGWTLIHEIYFYLVFSLLLVFRERWLSPLMALWGITAIIGWLMLSPIENPTVQLITNPLTLEFIFGSLIALIYFSGRTYRGLTFLVVAFAWWVLGYVMCVKLGFSPESSGWSRVFIFGFPAALSVYALVAIEKSFGWRPPIWLILIGDASFSIYLSHLLVIAAIGRLWGKLGKVGYLTNSIVLIVMFLSILSIGIASFKLIERPLLAFTRRFEQRARKPEKGLYECN